MAPVESVRPKFSASPWWSEARLEQTPHGQSGCPNTRTPCCVGGSLTSPNSGLGVRTCSGFLHLLASRWKVTATIPDLGLPQVHLDAGILIQSLLQMIEDRTHAIWQAHHVNVVQVGSGREATKNPAEKAKLHVAQGRTTWVCGHRFARSPSL